METTFNNWSKTHEGHECVTVTERFALMKLCGDLKSLGKSTFIAFDTETDGLTTDRLLVLLQVGFNNKTYLVSPDDASRVFGSMMNSEATIIAHNMSFDLITMMIHDDHFKDVIERKLISHPERFMCTMTLSRVLHGNAVWNRHGLNAVAEMYNCYINSDESMSTYALRENQPTLIPPLENPDFLWYSASDVIMLANVYEYMKAEANEQQVDLATFETMFNVIAGLMCHKGMRIDMAKLDEFTEKLNTESARLLEELNDKYGVNLRSWHNRGDLANAVKKLGGVFEDVPEGETPKVNKKALQAVRHTEDCPEDASRFITEFLKGKSSVSDANKIPGYRDLAVTTDGVSVLHPNFKPIGTVTGRTSCNNPNLQNVRKRGELSPRRLFIPREGYRLTSCDYSGIEVRVLAWLAQDSKLADHITEGYDMHQAMADHIGTDRATAKFAVFGMLYGEGTKSRSENYGLTYEQSEEVANRFMTTYPSSAAFLNGSVEHARETLATVRGRDSYVPIRTGWRCNVRRYDDGNWPAYLAANYHIQGWAAYYLKLAANRLFKEGFWKYCVMSVHDEFIFEFPEITAAWLLRQSMDIAEFEVDINGKPFRFEMEGAVYRTCWGGNIGVELTP